MKAVATSAAQQWPGQMGTLETVGARWPRQEANDASVKLTALGEALPKNDASSQEVSEKDDESEIGNPRF